MSHTSLQVLKSVGNRIFKMKKIEKKDQNYQRTSKVAKKVLVHETLLQQVLGNDIKCFLTGFPPKSFEPGGHYAKRNKPDTERQIFNDLTNVQNLKKSNLWKGVEQAGKMGRYWSKDINFQL